MRKQLQSRPVRRLGLAAALLVAGSSAVLAFGGFPGSWNVIDGGKTARKRTAGSLSAIIQNNGPDTISVSAKGTFKIAEGEILAGAKATLILPKGAKKVKLVDGTFNNGMGSKGSLIWSKKLSVNGQVIDTKPKL